MGAKHSSSVVCQYWHRRQKKWVHVKSGSPESSMPYAFRGVDFNVACARVHGKTCRAGSCCKHLPQKHNHEGVGMWVCPKSKSVLLDNGGFCEANQQSCCSGQRCDYMLKSGTRCPCNANSDLDVPLPNALLDQLQMQYRIQSGARGMVFTTPTFCNQHKHMFFTGMKYRGVAKWGPNAINAIANQFLKLGFPELAPLALEELQLHNELEKSKNKVTQNM